MINEILSLCHTTADMSITSYDLLNENSFFRFIITLHINVRK